MATSRPPRSARGETSSPGRSRPSPRRASPASRRRRNTPSAVGTPAPSKQTSRAAGGSARRPSDGQRPSLTGRAAILALVVGGLVVLYAIPLREYVEHRSTVAALKEENEERRNEVDRLRMDVERLKDPAYVRAQARKRLHFVMPGETGYVTLRGEGGQSVADGRAQPSNTVHAQDGPWYERLWSSVQQASRYGQEAR